MRRRSRRGACHSVAVRHDSVWPTLLAVLVVAGIAGAILGAVGAVANRVKTSDEFLLWVIGGVIGGVGTVLVWAGIASATVGLIVFTTAALLGSTMSPLLDNTDSLVAWLVSFLVKWVQSPLVTTAGLCATLIVTIRRGKIDFRRGMLFIAVGPGGGALTLGAVAWTQSGRFDRDGSVPDNLARHESTHSRTVASIGELGFYLTYVTIGAVWGSLQGGSWNNLNVAGCGNPFEKTAHTFTGDPAIAVRKQRRLQT